MKIQKFDGGVNVRQSQHLIGVNEGVTFTNIDTESGSLQSCKQATNEGLSLTYEDRYLKFEDDIITLNKVSDTQIEYRAELYYSVLGDYVQFKGDGAAEGDLGLNPPVITEVQLTSAFPAPPIVSELSVSEVNVAATSLYINTETYRYAFTKISNGVESKAFLYTYSPTSNGTAVRFSLPYEHKIYAFIGEMWVLLTRMGLENGDFANIGDGFIPPNQSTTLTLPYARGRYQWQNFVGNVYTDASYGDEWVWSEPTVSAELFPGAYIDVDDTLLDGVYTYVATVGIRQLGWESSSSAMAEANVTAGQVVTLVIDFPEADSRVDTLYIYRLGEELTDFTLVSTTNLPVFPVIKSDSTPTASSVGGRILSSQKYLKPIRGLTNINVMNGQLVGTYGSKLYFSIPGRLYAIPATNYRDFKQTLTGVAVIEGGLLVFSSTSTWLLNTSNLATSRVIQLSDEFGCVGHNTIVGYKTGAMWASQAGICSSAGGRVEVITKDKVGYLDLKIVRAVMHTEVYYGMSDNGFIYALDLRYAPSFVTYVLSAFNDITNATLIRQLYIQGTKLKVLFGSVNSVDSYAIFDSSYDEFLNWKSPKYLDGSYTNRKTYGTIYVRTEGAFEFSVYIDDKLVISRELVGSDTHEISLESLVGYSMQFELRGKGAVHEIEYNAMPRQKT